MLAVAAAVTVQIEHIAVAWSGTDEAWLVRNASWLVSPVLASWFVRRRRLRVSGLAPSIVAAAVAAVVVNAYPFGAESSTEVLAAAHLPIVLWLVLAASLTGSAWLVIRFITRRDPFQRLERWHLAYLPVLAAWAVLVAVLFPPAFAFD